MYTYTGKPPVPPNFLRNLEISETLETLETLETSETLESLGRAWMFDPFQNQMLRRKRIALSSKTITFYYKHMFD